MKTLKVYIKLLPYAIVSLLPLLILLASGIFGFLGQKENLSVYYSSRTFVLLLKSLFYGIYVGGILSVLGFVGGLAILCLNTSQRKWLIGLLLMMIPIPASVLALMWMEFFTWISNYVKIFNQTGWGITIFIQVMYLLPLSILISYSSMVRVPQTQVEVAKIIKSNVSVLTRIWIPLCKPGILLVMMVTFLLTISDYSIPAAFAVTIYPMEVFARYSISLDTKEAIISSLPLLVIGLGVVFPIADLLKVFYVGEQTKANAEFIQSIGFIKHLLSKIVILVTLLALILPIVFLITRIELNQNDIFGGGFNEILFTLILCFFASIISLPIMWLTGEFLIDHKGYLGMVMLPAVLSPSLIGASLIKMWNQTGFEWLYLSPIMPMMAMMIRFMPFGILAILAGQTQELKDSIAIGYMKVPSRSKVFLNITLPLMLPTLLVASGIIFLLGMGELGTTIMILPPGLSTITVKIFGYLHYGASEQISLMSLWVMAIIFFFSFVGNRIIRRGDRHDCIKPD